MVFAMGVGYDVIVLIFSLSELGWARFAAIALVLLTAGPVNAAERPDDDPSAVLSDAQWRRLDEAADRALHWIGSRQRPDGSFNAPDRGQPGITSLCVLAFASRGHLPGHGAYGQQINRAIEYILSCQRRDGMFARQDHRRTSHAWVIGSVPYSHTMAGLTLSELYGMTDSVSTSGSPEPLSEHWP